MRNMLDGEIRVWCMMSYSSGKWDSRAIGLICRYWDTWRTPGKIYTLGLTRLERVQAEERVGEEHFTVSKTNDQRFFNVLNGTGLVGTSST